MLQTIKRYLPEPIKKPLRHVKQKTYDQWKSSNNILKLLENLKEQSQLI